ncbi:hypothetical protein HMPREF1980_00419, partial [Actinomyces sp. oral taxon 172 str. F0311]
LSYPDARYLSRCSLPIRMLVSYPDAYCPRGHPVIDEHGS